MRDIREFVCWQLADELKRQVIELTEVGPAARDFKFRDHLREASESATAKMTEGFKYFEPAEFARFLRYAVGSLGETQNRGTVNEAAALSAKPRHRQRSHSTFSEAAPSCAPGRECATLSAMFAVHHHHAHHFYRPAAGSVVI